MPELLLGLAMETRRALDKAWAVMRQQAPATGDAATVMGRRLGEDWLRNQTSNGGETTVVCSEQSAGGHGKVLALLWAQTLLYAAPYDNVEVHMRHLSQDGEFITHLWPCHTTSASTSGNMRKKKKPKSLQDRRGNLLLKLTKETRGKQKLMQESRGKQKKFKRLIMNRI